ncbi:MBL fold metallo-hydrolase RNA specificity domain-containing protein [Ruminococcus flavefaciens]|uniref:MBL fold metallo-hydrolase RNA specificity domain-containing protein n=1 Tax=Ruminococcus flavefaciens TaxID=1265 RepID=UPI0026EB7DBC|nr:MBL fold metallo-hydrolase [Ruminococcus flavefaciens]MDD7515321.1 MBL fold metallo-hydrolase [Ruminococcus flavefaciens]MDY5692596.1 MBL fold metallo-hydrolase [Ruminococcus flavefaciens]
MKMTFIGATHEVTGSCTYIEACGKKFLVDFGMQQGEDIFENVQIPVSPSSIDFVLLTHAHIDHSGLLPLLYSGGFQGEIHATEATTNLCSVMLRDSAHIQEFEAEWRSRKAERRGEPNYEPLYTMEDALGAIELFVPHQYEKEVEIYDGIKVLFRDAGHLLGSSSILLTLTEDGVTKTIAFSGDIGNIHQPLIRDPQHFTNADYVVMESTYGNRVHDRPTDYTTSLAKVLQETFDRGGSVIIPSFAVGRTQEMLYFIRHIKAEGLVTGHDGFPVYVDSPLANEATDIFVNNRESCYDEEALSFVRKGINPISFDDLIRTVTSNDSIAINSDERPKVIISASGMCEAGRIKHHLKHNLWKKQNTILFVGYQAGNTLGRSLVEGAKRVKLFGETVKVAAHITQLPGISGHADVNGLLDWAKSVSGVQRYFINHGEATSAESFAQRLRDELGAEVYVPYSGAEFDIAENVITIDAEPIPIPKKKNTANMSIAYSDLIAASDRLSALIKDSEGRTNADMRQLTEAIHKLCDSWKL